MGVQRWMYELWYRYGDPPWIGEPRQHLVELVESGRLAPGRAIDLGCGVGDNAIFLAKHGFEVVGVDVARSAIERARAKAVDAGVEVEFRAADLLRLPDAGTFDLAVDYGTCDDLSDPDRAVFRDVAHRLLRPGGQLLTWCFEWEPLWWERVLTAVLPMGQMAMRPGEVETLYAGRFHIERLDGGTGSWPRAWAVYLLTARGLAEEVA